MNDLEEALRDTLIVNPPSLDVNRLQSGALRRMAVRKTRRMIVALSRVGGAAVIVLVLLDPSQGKLHPADAALLVDECRKGLERARRMPE